MAAIETHAERLWPQLTVVAAVAASHMSMPNHWLPYSLVARAHSWTLRKALFLTFLGATGHVTNTILISLLISEIGGALISHEHYRLLSSSVLLLGGLYYLYTYAIQRKRTSCCDTRTQLPSLPKSAQEQQADSPAVHRTAAVSVVMLTALSPCVGSMPVLLSLMAPPVQASTVLAASGVLLATSAAVMCALVAVSFLGAATMDFARIRRHERLMLGAGLVLLAGLTFFVFADDHDHHHHTHGGHEVAAVRERGMKLGPQHHHHDHEHHNSNHGQLEQRHGEDEQGHESQDEGIGHGGMLRMFAKAERLRDHRSEDSPRL